MVYVLDFRGGSMTFTVTSIAPAQDLGLICREDYTQFEQPHLNHIVRAIKGTGPMWNLDAID